MHHQRRQRRRRQSATQRGACAADDRHALCWWWRHLSGGRDVAFVAVFVSVHCTLRPHPRAGVVAATRPAEGISPGEEAVSSEGGAGSEQSTGGGADRTEADGGDGDSGGCGRTEERQDSAESALLKRAMKWRVRAEMWQHRPSRALAREIKAAPQLGVIMGAFTLCFFPYFVCFMVVAFCDGCIGQGLMTAMPWIGYINSTVNPFLYPLCNMNFRRKFSMMLRLEVAPTAQQNHSMRYSATRLSPSARGRFLMSAADGTIPSDGFCVNDDVCSMCMLVVL